MYSNVTNLWLGKGRVTQNPLNFYENVLLECTFKTSCLTIFLLNLSVKKETNFCTTDLGWWLICISWQVYLIGSSTVICPREPCTLHTRSHSSYHVSPSLPTALAVMAVEIWLIRSQLSENSVFLDIDSYGKRGFATRLCCWLHVLVEGKERLSFQVGWIFVGLEPCEGPTLGENSNRASSWLHGTPRQAGPASTMPAQVSNTAPECSEGMTGVWKAKVFCCETAFLKW